MLPVGYTVLPVVAGAVVAENTSATEKVDEQVS